MGVSSQTESTYLMNEVSRRVGLSPKRIRDYEKGGLIKPVREPKTNNRRYTEFDIRQILRIKELLHEHGFTLACLRYFLSSAPCWIIFNCGNKAICPAVDAARTPCYKIDCGIDSDKKAKDCTNCPIFLNRDVKPIPLLEKS